MTDITRDGNRKALIGVGLLAGIVQAAAGVAMYLAGVYFASWSMLVSLAVLLGCIVAGTRWYTANYLNDEITYRQALGVGVIISVGTGLVYGIYNMVSISFFYPHFLDDLVQASIAHATATQQAHDSFASMRAEVSARGIAIPNVIRLSALGSVLSLASAFVMKRPKST